MGKFNFKNQEDFEKIKVEAETFYATLQDVFCPYFKEKVAFEVKFYEFIAVLDNVRVKVVIKEVSGGQKHFWSVIPFWGIDKITSKRILHSGDPEND